MCRGFISLYHRPFSRRQLIVEGEIIGCTILLPATAEPSLPYIPESGVSYDNEMKRFTFSLLLPALPNLDQTTCPSQQGDDPNTKLVRWLRFHHYSTGIARCPHGPKTRRPLNLAVIDLPLAMPCILLRLPVRSTLSD